MRTLRLASGPLVAVLLAGAALLAGCIVMPSGGTPVLVDHRAGSFWSPEGKLLAVSDDQKRCRVAVRDRSLVFVRHFWTECLYVHTRTTRG